MNANIIADGSSREGVQYPQTGEQYDGGGWFVLVRSMLVKIPWLSPRCPLEVFAPPNSPVHLQDNSMVFINEDGSRYELDSRVGQELGQELRKIQSAKVYPNFGFHGIDLELERSAEDLKRIADYFCVAQDKQSGFEERFQKGDVEDQISVDSTVKQMILNDMIESTISHTLFGNVINKPPLPKRRNKAAKIHPISSMDNLNLLTDNIKNMKDKHANLAAMFCTESPDEALLRRHNYKQDQIAAMFCTESVEEAAKRRRKNGKTCGKFSNITFANKKQIENSKEYGHKKVSKKNVILRFLSSLRKLIARKLS